MSKTQKILLWCVGVIVGLACIGAVLPDGPYDKTSCAQLTRETLKMTGVNATEPYDLEKVRAINKARDAKDCGSWLHPWDEE